MRRKRKAQEFFPQNALERKLYKFYKAWMKWFDDMDAARAKVFSEEDAGGDEWKQWHKEYDKAHKKPHVPKDLRIDFCQQGLGQNLFHRLSTGYYREQKCVVVIDHYDCVTTWKIHYHSDFAWIAIDIVRAYPDSFTMHVPASEDPPPSIAEETFDAFPTEYAEKLKEDYKREWKEWLDSEKWAAEAKVTNERVEAAEGGDEIAAALLVTDKMRCHQGLKIYVTTFEEPRPAKADE